jgi:hypothetical protein
MRFFSIFNHLVTRAERRATFGTKRAPLSTGKHATVGPSGHANQKTHDLRSRWQDGGIASKRQPPLLAVIVRSGLDEIGIRCVSIIKRRLTKQEGTRHGSALGVT